MAKYNPENERIKREYFDFLKEAKRYDASTIDTAAKALSRFEAYTNHRSFKTFCKEQATGFKHKLAKALGERSGKPLSKSTLSHTLRQLKAFFEWLALQKGYKSKIAYPHAEYFNLSAKEDRIARATRRKHVPTIEDIATVVDSMPTRTSTEMRDRALVAFILLTGARDSAVISFKLKHLDLPNRSLYQDAREVKTKASKSFTSYFFPVGEEFEVIVQDWIQHLTNQERFTPNDPIFPKSKPTPPGQKETSSQRLSREHWSNSGPVRRIFKQAFQKAEIPYTNPHTFRDTLVLLGEKRCRSPEEFKAWSQNLGHQGVLTTFYSYGEIQNRRQQEILSRLKQIGDMPNAIEVFADKVADKLASRANLFDPQKLANLED